MMSDFSHLKNISEDNFAPSEATCLMVDDKSYV